MKIIEKMLDTLEEEVEGAKDYAEKYIDCKARGNMSRANKYKEMATDELKHASFLREFNIMDVEELKKVYTLSEEETSEWEHRNKHLTEHMAIVRHMLAM